MSKELELNIKLESAQKEDLKPIYRHPVILTKRIFKYSRRVTLQDYFNLLVLPQLYEVKESKIL